MLRYRLVNLGSHTAVAISEPARLCREASNHTRQEVEFDDAETD